jgi:hypothetical protein
MFWSEVSLSWSEMTITWSDMSQNLVRNDQKVCSEVSGPKRPWSEMSAIRVQNMYLIHLGRAIRDPVPRPCPGHVREYYSIGTYYFLYTLKQRIIICRI